jgi:hypothetical protein
MPTETRIVAPGPCDRTVRTADGQVLHAPPDWELLPPGDGTLTRRVKTAGPTWTIQEKKGRKVFSRGVWAPADRIAAIRDELVAERSTDAYAKRRAADKARRERKHTEYVEDFRETILTFLDFSPSYATLAEKVADAVAQYTTPVGSGTVARTQRIPIEQRVESAVIAWLRHNTTTYDNMKIPRVKGKRREVRRMLAEQSRRLLERYRDGRYRDGHASDATCPLLRALSHMDISGS